MSVHECQFAELIGQSVSWLTKETGGEVCRWCHIDKPKVTAVKSAAKPVIVKE